MGIEHQRHRAEHSGPEGMLTRDTANAALTAIAKNLLELRKRLAALVFSGGKTEQDAARRRQFDALSQQEQEATHKLAREGGRSGAEGIWAELEAVRRAVAPSAVLVEICRFREYDFTQPKWKKEEREQLSARYAAWLIPAADEGAVQFVDLGDAAAIDAAVLDARRALEGARPRSWSWASPTPKRQCGRFCERWLRKSSIRCCRPSATGGGCT